MNQRKWFLFVAHALDILALVLPMPEASPTDLPFGNRHKLTETRFVTSLINVLRIRILSSQTLPDFSSLLSIIEFAVKLNLADDAQQRYDSPAKMTKLILMNRSLLNGFSMVLRGYIGQQYSRNRHETRRFQVGFY